MTVLSLSIVDPSSPAPTAGAGISNSDIIGIITAALTLLTVIAAVVAVAYAKGSAQSAADATNQLTRISANMKNVASLQERSLEEARRLRLLELLSRRASILEEIVNTILTMSWIAAEVEPSQLTDDSLELFNSRFNQERRKLIIALKLLPGIELPKCRTVAKLGDFLDALPELKPAEAEADRALTQVLSELEEEARKTPDK